MRWLATLQLVIGMGVLFGLGYLAVPRFIEPLTENRVVETAEAHAVVAAGEVTSSWERSRSGRRALIRALAESPVFDDAKDELWADALGSAAVQMGGGVAAVVDRSSKVVASEGDAAHLARLLATKDALGGAATVRLEAIGDTLHVVSAAPIGDRRALIVASPIGDMQLRGWTRGLPANVSVVVLDREKTLASTLPPRHREAFAPVARTANGAVDLGVQRFRAARRSISDDAGAQFTILGMAEIDGSGMALLVGHVQLLVMLLGGFALVLAMVVLMLAPGGAAKAEELEVEERPISDTQPLDMPELDIPEPVVQSVSAPDLGLPKKLTPREAIERAEAKAMAEEPPPLAPPAPKIPAPAPSLESVTMPQPKKRPESDSTFALDAEQRFGAPPQAPPPAGPSPFDQIARAAFSAAPPPVAAPVAPPTSRGGEDLLAPKGVDMSQIAAMANAPRQASSPRPLHAPALPTDLPGLKSDPFPIPLAPSSSRPSHAQTAAPPPPTFGSLADLPGLKSDARGSYDVNEVETQPARLQPSRGPVDPWQNPVVPARPAPSISSQISAPPPPVGPPMAYDEEHYRLVYNDFVSSKARLGEAVDNITYEGFRSKLRSSEEALINQHGCRAVRFQVLVRDNTVSLRPQLVR